MAKKRKGKQRARAEPKSNLGFYTLNNWDMIECSGYTKLSDNPEVVSAVNKIADLVSGMTIHLMENTDNGDVRINDELAKKIDIYPNDLMTRKTFISIIVKNLLLYGDGNSVILPITKNGLLDQLYPIPASNVSFIQKGFYDYGILVNGIEYDASEMIHITLNPNKDTPWIGEGYRLALKNIVNNLSQASATKNSFMKSKWKPSVIVRVDGMAEEFSNKEGRKKILEKYVESTDAGEPWLLPADMFEIEVVKPLSLNDLAINEAVEIDKKTVASILDVPPFILGVGTFNEGEWNNFINTRIKGICNAIEQAFTKQLLLSPRRYFKFNNRSLFSYDIEKLSRVGDDNYTRGIMSGNEVRDWLGLAPLEGLDKLIILENYIPRGMIGDQSKLQGGD